MIQILKYIITTISVSFVLTSCNSSNNTLTAFERQSRMSEGMNMFLADSINAENYQILFSPPYHYFYVPSKTMGLINYDTSVIELMDLPGVGLLAFRVEDYWLNNMSYSQWEKACDFPLKDAGCETEIRVRLTETKEKFSRNFWTVDINPAPEMFLLYFIRGSTYNYRSYPFQGFLQFETAEDVKKYKRSMKRKPFTPIEFKSQLAFYPLYVTAWHLPK